MRDRDMPEAEWNTRVDLAAAYRLVALYGWDDLIFTHLSARVPGPEHHFLINPYHLMFEEMTASSLVKIDTAGRPVDDDAANVNVAGFVIHSAIHMGRDDVQAVLHLHTPCGQAVSAMRDGLLPATQTAIVAGTELSFHEYEGIATSLDERKRLVADLGSNNAMLLRNHGTLTVGENVADAFLRMYFLERACEAQVHMLAAGRDNLRLPPQAAIEQVHSEILGDGVVDMVAVSRQLAWPALLRKLDRVDPSYRT